MSDVLVPLDELETLLEYARAELDDDLPEFEDLVELEDAVETLERATGGTHV